MDLGEDALHLLEVGLAAAVEIHAPAAAVEQRYVEMLLQHADAVCDGCRRHAELGRGAGEAPVSGGASKNRRLSSGGRSSTVDHTFQKAQDQYCYSIAHFPIGGKLPLPGNNLRQRVKWQISMA